MARSLLDPSRGREGDEVRAELDWNLQKRRDLVRNAADNPPIAFSQFTGRTELTPADWQLDWRVAYCFPRQEKLFATQLWKLGISFLFPMVERERLSGGRRRRSLIPVFPSYVFFAGDGDARLAAPTLVLAKVLADTAIRVEKEGLRGKVYLDARGIRKLEEPNVMPGSYADYDRALLITAKGIEEQTEFEVVLDTSPRSIRSALLRWFSRMRLC